MVLNRLIINRLGSISEREVKLKRGLNLIDGEHKEDIAIAFYLATGGNSEKIKEKYLTDQTVINALFTEGEEKIKVTIDKEGFSVSDENGDQADKYKKAFDENGRRGISCYCFASAYGNRKEKICNRIYRNGLAPYKGEIISDEYIDGYGAKSFRHTINNFIYSSKPEIINSHQEYIDIERSGKFAVVSKDGKVVKSAGLSQYDKAVFDYMCFLKMREFWCEIYKNKDMNAPETPLLIADFSGGLDMEGQQTLLKMACSKFGQVLALMQDGNGNYAR